MLRLYGLANELAPAPRLLAFQAGAAPAQSPVTVLDYDLLSSVTSLAPVLVPLLGAGEDGGELYTVRCGGVRCAVYGGGRNRVACLAACLLAFSKGCMLMLAPALWRRVSWIWCWAERCTLWRHPSARRMCARAALLM